MHIQCIKWKYTGDLQHFALYSSLNFIYVCKNEHTRIPIMKKIFATLCGCIFAAAAVQAQNLWDMEGLENIRANAGDPVYKEAIAHLCAEADKMLERKPYTVMDKPQAPASGDKHDYMSLARYYWPDPASPNGLPYISRDGVSNPELNAYDRNALGNMGKTVSTLTLAWYMTGERKYSDKAAEQIRAWFFDEATRMNPHLEYAQIARGHHGDKGRGYGLLDSYSFIGMLDAVCVLEKSKSFTKKDSKMLKEWFRKYLHWFLTSPQGLEDYKGSNNHSVAYDVQVVAMAKFLGDKRTASEFIKTFPERRVFTQIEPDGRQPHELRRTLAFGYSQYNLSHMVDIMMMGKSLGIDIINAESPDGRCFFKAMDFLVQYAGKGVESWPYKQISQWDDKMNRLYLDLYRIAKYLAPERQDYMDIYKKYYKADAGNLFSNYIYTEGLPSTKKETVKQLADRVFTLAAEQYTLMDALTPADKFPKTFENGKNVFSDGVWWCSGFPAGCYWYIYEYTKDKDILALARKHTAKLSGIMECKTSHDIGFQVNDSYGHAYRLTGEEAYLPLIKASAERLCGRFNPNTGCTRSWDWGKWAFPVIIDNMMNLELLENASKLFGENEFDRIARSHANTTMKNHFRPDFSCYHVVDYNPQNGEVLRRMTFQGYVDESCWSRGEAWALYGYTMMYRETRDEAYLQMAENIANFLFGKLPQDGIPYWDFDAPGMPDVLRDASAGAIMASAFVDLASLTHNNTASEKYLVQAEKMIRTLAGKEYLADKGENGCFLLKHSVGFFNRGSEVDVPLTYADYYFLEAVLKLSARLYPSAE